MRKPILSLMMICCTAVCTLGIIVFQPNEKAVEARVVTVQRGDIHQVVAVTGRIAYADGTYIYARSSGVVSQVCVEENQRVGAGEALVRLDTALQENALAAFLAAGSEIPVEAAEEWKNDQTYMEYSVLRAVEDGTVRQLLVQNDMPVAAGTPVVRMTSGQQEIVCTVAARDAEKLVPGMWAWISSEGETLGFAEVVDVGELTADALTGMTGATVTLHPEQHIDLPEGAAVDADIYLAGSDDVLTLPVEAITEQSTVWWVNDGRCTEIPVSVIVMDEILAWVALPEGLQVAVGDFKEGQQIVEASP